MAKKKPRGKPFEVGHPPVSPGRPKQTLYQRLLKGDTKNEFYEILLTYWHTPLKKLLLLKDSDELTPIQLGALRWFIKIANDPENEDIKLLAKIVGANFDKLIVDNISSDGSHTHRPIMDLSHLTLEQLKQLHEHGQSQKKVSNN